MWWNKKRADEMEQHFALNPVYHSLFGEKLDPAMEIVKLKSRLELLTEEVTRMRLSYMTVRYEVVKDWVDGLRWAVLEALNPPTEGAVKVAGFETLKEVEAWLKGRVGR